MKGFGYSIAMVLIAACSTSSDDANRILAEVGPDALTTHDVRTAIPYAIWQSDSLNATNEYVKQWTMTRLLASEAERLGLHELNEVANLIRTHRDDVLIETLRDRALNSLTDEIRVSEAEIDAYFEKHKDQFSLKESHVRIRHLTTISSDLATAAKVDLERGGDWEDIVTRYASDKTSALASTETLRPTSSQVSVQSLRIGSVAPIREQDGQFHVIQLLETYPIGSIPDISWVKDRILEWLTIEKRRIALLTFEQNLLLKAQADGIVRNPSSP